MTMLDLHQDVIGYGTACVREEFNFENLFLALLFTSSLGRAGARAACVVSLRGWEARAFPPAVQVGKGHASCLEAILAVSLRGAFPAGVCVLDKGRAC